MNITILMIMKNMGPDVLVIMIDPTKLPTTYEPIKKIQKIVKKNP